MIRTTCNVKDIVPGVLTDKLLNDAIELYPSPPKIRVSVNLTKVLPVELELPIDKVLNLSLIHI